MKIKQLYIGHVCTLCCGSLIYILFRTSSLRMFSWFESLNLLSFIKAIRNRTTIYTNDLSDLILFSLPDGLWLFSYISLMLYLWKNEVKYENLLWIFSIPIISIMSELGQIIKIVPGTFDITDLAMYLLGTFLPFLIYQKSITINLKQS
ncbi:hypothetical protein IRZ71_04090 [Flavobacterium sp. ANB]|uniref:hypothetical protein n=1 Tax=unclassified Flavobacterium TaxID=196869 RepID=UPI0012B96949|nr:MULTISPECIES: hypothetical protein [unclassified Flavobacterium]MBF4515505.1 hypothetical protein [Flavobacterium sp. ANB]MTD68508.1 hypothetical protein [Flavobacterium sp. LC2016-13]